MFDNSPIYRALLEALQEDHRVAMATIIHTAGSVPRELGAKMLIHPAGQNAGTVGGGCGEAEVIRHALDAMADGQRRVVRVDLTGEISLESDGICGGTMDVLVEPWPPAEGSLDEWVPLLQAMAEPEEHGPALALLTRLPPAPASYILLRDAGDVEEYVPAEIRPLVRAALERRGPALLSLPDSDERWFLEVQRRPPTLLIAGAGHIAIPLARMGTMLGFRVAVVDDRLTFVNPERFPDADMLICDLFDRALARFPIDADTYIVIITRGHQHDVTCLRQVLGSPAAYIGMIGSRRRVRGVFGLLEQEEHIPPDLLGRVYAPIGLDIGAHTPAEIALAILAEIVSVMRGGRAHSLESKVYQQRRPAGA